jgi:hypothetical protein
MTYRHNLLNDLVIRVILDNKWRTFVIAFGNNTIFAQYGGQGVRNSNLPQKITQNKGGCAKKGDKEK